MKTKPDQRRRRATPPHDGLTAHVLDLLETWHPVDARRMFSGVGLFAFGRMFALIFDETLYLKDAVDADGKPVAADPDKEYFEYERGDKVIRMGYYKVPERALDEPSYLIELATASCRAAAAAGDKQKKQKRTSAKPTQKIGSASQP